MSGLESLFADAAELLGAGLRGPDLGAAFRARFDAAAPEHLAELERLVAAGLRRLGLAEWGGARLGPGFAEFPRLGDPDCVARLAMELLVGEGEASDAGSGLGWLAGPLFASGRLVAYLRAAEEDPGRAMAYLNRNLRSELQRRRRIADPAGAALFDNLAAAALTLVEAEQAGRSGAAPQLVAEQPLGPEPPKPAALAQALVESGALGPFLEAVAKNAERTTVRNSPMRGPAIEQPLAAGLGAALGGASPGSLDLSALANQLRGAWPLPEELSTRSMPTGSDGELNLDLLGPDPSALDPAELCARGPVRIADLLEPWRAALEAATSLSGPRKAKLGGYLDELERLLREHAGLPPATWRSDLRRSLGIKPQTWSDDWKALDGLFAELSGGGHV
ncbi:MAG: hypothetical protein P1V81_16945 [Planctomycetota bacterium]|nr:hypothetical protein [Planctomycetota bacterium]